MFYFMDPLSKLFFQLHPELRTKCEVWTRVMGYHRPVSQFNKGKQSEHYERTHFQEEVCLSSSLAR